MTMEKWRFLFPPRAESVILPDLLDFYEKRRWVAQIKKNGACAIVAVGPGGQLIMSKRDGSPFANYTPPPSIYTPLFALPTGWYVFVGELLHQKTPHIKNMLYLYDLLVWKGESLDGKTYAQRWMMMAGAFDWRDCKTGLGFYKLPDHNLLLAKNFEIGFGQLFRACVAVEDEGLVLRDPEARLAPCLKANSNVDWLVKARKGTRNFGF